MCHRDIPTKKYLLQEVGNGKHKNGNSSKELAEDRKYARSYKPDNPSTVRNRGRRKYIGAYGKRNRGERTTRTEKTNKTKFANKAKFS